MGRWPRRRDCPDHLLHPAHHRQTTSREVHLRNDCNSRISVILRYNLAGANPRSERHHDRRPCDWDDKRKLPVDGYCWTADLPVKVWTDVSRQLHLLDCTAVDLLGCACDKLVLCRERRQRQGESGVASP